MYTYLRFGGVPTKTQAPFLLLKKKEKRAYFCLCCHVGARPAEKVERYESGQKEECCLCREELGEVYREYRRQSGPHFVAEDR